MATLTTRPLSRGKTDDRYRLSLGVFITPDVNDDQAWQTIITRGIPHHDKWSQNIIKPHYQTFALSYKHTDHDLGKLSREQSDELRRVLSEHVGGSKIVLWVDGMYMMSERLGLQDYSSKWARYGLLPCVALPVIRLKSEWDRMHERSNKRSGWLWLERTLGRSNRGVSTGDGVEKENRRNGMTVSEALTTWLDVQDEFNFRPGDEIEVRDEISGGVKDSSHHFRCPGGQACIGYLVRRRDEGCDGSSRVWYDLARSVNCTFFEDKLILSSVGRIAEFVVHLDYANCKLKRLDLSREELQPYTKVLASREHAFRNVRWLGLERFSKA